MFFFFVRKKDQGQGSTNESRHNFVIILLSFLLTMTKCSLGSNVHLVNVYLVFTLVREYNGFLRTPFNRTRKPQ